MKTLRLIAASQFELQDVPLPELGPEDVLVQVRAVGICGSDVHGMDGSSGRRIPPITMGHEASGVIESVGSAVTEWAVGDRVTFDSTVYCGSCWYCNRGEINLCDNRMVLGVSCGDYRRHGAFAEFVDIPQRILYRIPEGVSFEQAAFVEPVSIAVHAVNRSGAGLGDSAVVVGTGMIGLLIVQVLRAAGVTNIIAVDLDPDKLALAEEFGASAGLIAGEGLVEEIRKRTNGRGADHAFEVVGAEAPFRTSVECVRKGATVTLVGNLSPEVTFPMQWAVTRELTILGSCASAGEYPACLDLIATKKIDVDRMISEKIGLAEGADAFERLHAGESGLLKVILLPLQESL